MATVTTLADYEAVNRTLVPTELREHVEAALVSAEDDLLREVGYTFWEDGPDSTAGRDWKRCAAWRAAEYIESTDPEYRAAVAGPFQSETIGRYSYTLRQPTSNMLDNPRYRRILDYYVGVRSTGVAYYGAGPARDEYTR